MTAKKPVVDTIEAAMQVAAEVAEGRLSPAALEAAAVAECRQLVGQVIGPDDALWPLQLEIARGVLAAGGVPANELAEWLSVQRQAEVGGTGDTVGMPEIEIPEPPMPDELTLDGVLVTAADEPNGVIDSVPSVKVGEPMHVLDDDCWCHPVVEVVEGRGRRTHRET